MSVLRKKMTAQPEASNLNESDILRVWKGMSEGCLHILEDMTEGLDWAEERFTAERLELSEFVNALPEMGLYTGFGPSEKETTCLCLVSTPMAAILNKCGIDGRILNFSSLENYAVSELDLFMMEPFIGFVKESLGKMMRPNVLISGDAVSDALIANFDQFQKEEIDLSEFDLSEKHKSWFKISLGFKADLTEGDGTQTVSFQVILPMSYLEETLKNAETQTERAQDFILPEDAKYLGRHIDKSVTSVRAVLDSLQMSVADCTRLEIGQIIPLPGVSLENISLEVEMRERRLAVASGLLGIHKTRRAVKLSDELSQEFRSDVIC